MLLPLAFVLHVGAFLRTSAPDHVGAGVFTEDFLTFTTNNPTLSSILSVFIVFLNAVMLNRFAILNRLSVSISLYPGALYVVLVSLLPVWKGLSILTLCSLGLILLLTNIGYSSTRYKVDDKIFNIGFFSGLLFLLYPPSVLFLLLGVIGMSLLRPYKRREYLNLLNGFIVPHFFAIVYFFWHDDLSIYWVKTFTEGIEFWQFPEYSTRDLIFSAFWAIALIASLIGYPRFTMKKEIQARKKIDITYWSLLITAGVVLISPVWDIQLWFLAAPAIAFMISEHLINTKNEIIADLIYTTLLIAALAIQFLSIPA